jgi:UrcA family protein
MRSPKPAILTAALLLTLLGPPIAWCKPPESSYDVVGKVRVELKGLDLQNAQDARTLLQRLKQAAYRACGGNPRFSDSYRLRPEETVRAYEECRTNAVKRAVDQIGAQKLAQLYAE